MTPVTNTAKLESSCNDGAAPPEPLTTRKEHNSMTSRITKAHLEAKIDWLNHVLGRPKTPWTRDESGRMSANIGNFHLGGAYGRTQIQEMVSSGGGVRTHSGYETKRGIAARLDSMAAGAVIAKEQ